MGKIKQKIVFLCSRFGGGGAEKHLLRILNEVDYSEFDIHLVLTRDGGNYEQYLAPEVKVEYLSKNIKSSTLALVLAYFKLGRTVDRINPDLVVSFMDRQNVLLATVIGESSDYPIVLCCQNMPSRGLKDQGLIGKLHIKRLTNIYSRAKEVICISKGVRDDVRKLTGISDERLPVIYNAGFDDNLPSLIGSHNNHHANDGKQLLLLACGRLTTQKGFDLLLRAISQLPLSLNFRLEILGTGPDEEALRKQTAELGLEGQVEFLGFQQNPYPFFTAADVFILSSRWEGFGNVITEAMACQTAVVSTNCPSGPDEIISHGVNGWLVETEDIGALAKGIKRVCEDAPLRRSLAKAGQVRSKDFSPQSVSKQYFDRFSDIIISHNLNRPVSLRQQP